MKREAENNRFGWKGGKGRGGDEGGKNGMEGGGVDLY